MRIISGKNRGRKLIDCSHLKNLRPTTDRNKENLFNLLNSSAKLKEIGFELVGCKVLDVFCGSGSIAFEALSRGAKSATLLDNNSKHLEIAQQNADFLKESEVQFFQIDLTKRIWAAKEQFNFIYIDPPYSQNMVQTVLDNLIAAGWVKDKALIVVEHAADETIELEGRNLTLLDQRQYDITSFSFLLYSS